MPIPLLRVLVGPMSETEGRDAWRMVLPVILNNRLPCHNCPPPPPRGMLMSERRSRLIARHPQLWPYEVLTVYHAACPFFPPIPLPPTPSSSPPHLFTDHHHTPHPRLVSPETCPSTQVYCYCRGICTSTSALALVSAEGPTTHVLLCSGRC